MRTETVAVLTIPKGVKENMYFVVNNDKNVVKRKPTNVLKLKC